MYSLDQFDKIAEGLQKESDRGAVLIGAAWVEDCLEQVLRAQIEKTSDFPPTQIETLLDPAADKSLLGSAGARLKAARMFGLIDATTHEALSKLFSLRNNPFAHFSPEIAVANLSSKSVRSRLNTFVDGITAHPLSYKFKPIRDPSFSPERCRFILGIMNAVYILFLLHSTIKNQPPFEPPH